MDWNSFWTVAGFWVGTGGLIIGVIGIIIAISTRKNRAFYYSIKGNTIIEDYKSNLKELSVRYKDAEIENLSVCRFAFWNAGNDPIGQSDISTNAPLLIYSSEGNQILDIYLIQSSSIANGIEVCYSDKHKAYLLKFDYLNPRMGGVLQVIHTANSMNEILFQGEIKGIKKLIKYDIPKYEGKNLKPSNAIFPTLFFLIMSIAILFTKTDQEGNDLQVVGFTLLGFTLILMFGIAMDLREENKIPSFLKSYLTDLPFIKRSASLNLKEMFNYLISRSWQKK